MDDEVDEEYTTTVEYYDDSKGKKWDERNSRVAAKLKEARARRDGARPDGHEKVRLLKEKQKAQGDIDRLSIELQRLDEEIVEQRRKMRQMSGDRLKQTVAQSWRAEIVRIGAEFEQAIAGFRNDISSFLDVYWQGRTERVEAYIAGLLNNEREVAVRQKMASDAYRKMVADKRVFDRVAGELASELKALT